MLVLSVSNDCVKINLLLQSSIGIYWNMDLCKYASFGNKTTTTLYLMAIFRNIWITGAMLLEEVVTTGAIKCGKLQSDHHHQQLFTGQMLFLSPNQQCEMLMFYV